LRVRRDQKCWWMSRLQGLQSISRTWEDLCAVSLPRLISPLIASP